MVIRAVKGEVGKVEVLNKEVREGVFEKVRFQPRLKEGEGAKCTKGKCSGQKEHPGQRP